MPPATRCTWKARTSSRSRHSGERPKKRPNLATACTYDRCVAGDRLRIVMSSIMRRRRGLTWVIGEVPSLGLEQHPDPGRPVPLRSRRSPPLYRVSGLVQSPHAILDAIRPHGLVWSVDPTVD